jgi:hypothetical protein
MTDTPGARVPRSTDLPARLRLTALVAVIGGVILLAAAAFVLSYAGIHAIALAAGVSATLARLYPVIFDALLVAASAAALAFRGAGWWTKCYAWLSILALLAAASAADAVHAMGVSLPRRPAAAAVAVIPWALLLIGFGLWLAMLRHLRASRADGRTQANGKDPSAGPSLHTTARAVARTTDVTTGAAGRIASATSSTPGSAGRIAGGAAGTAARAIGSSTARPAGSGDVESAFDARPGSEPGQPASEPAAEHASDPAAAPVSEPTAAPVSEPDQPDDAGQRPTLLVPQQPLPAPVPAPSPHFDRMRSTPTPPEEDPRDEEPAHQEPAHQEPPEEAPEQEA